MKSDVYQKDSHSSHEHRATAPWVTECHGSTRHRVVAIRGADKSTQLTLSYSTVLYFFFNSFFLSWPKRERPFSFSITSLLKLDCSSTDSIYYTTCIDSSADWEVYNERIKEIGVDQRNSRIPCKNHESLFFFALSTFCQANFFKKRR